MAILYVWSGATGLADGTSWTDAYLTEEAARLAWSPGDEIYKADDHNEVGTASIALSNGSASYADRIPIYRVNRTTNGYSPTNETDTIQFDQSGGAYSLTDNSSIARHGDNLLIGDNLNIGGAANVDMVDCYVELNSYRAVLNQGDGNGVSRVTWKNSTINFSYVDAANGGRIIFSSGHHHFKGCVFKGYPYSAVFAISSRSPRIIVESCDFTGITFGANELVASTQASAWAFDFINCVIPSGINIHSGFVNDGSRIYFWSTDSAGNLYATQKYGFRGDVVEDTGVYFTGGYTDQDGSTPLSMKMTPAPNVDIASPLESIDIPVFVESTGAKTFEVEFLENFTVAPTKRELWGELLYLGSSTSTLLSLSTDREFVKSAGYSALTSGAGTSAWTNPPAGSRSAKISLNATVNQTGLHYMRIYLAKYESGKSVYYNPPGPIA